jgi:hypothetical protein
MFTRVIAFLGTSQDPAHKKMIPHAAVASAFIESRFEPSNLDHEVSGDSLKLNFFKTDGEYEFTPGPVKVKITTENDLVRVTAMEKNGNGVITQFSTNLDVESIKNKVKSGVIDRVTACHPSIAQPSEAKRAFAFLTGKQLIQNIPTRVAISTAFLNKGFFLMLILLAVHQP